MKLSEYDYEESSDSERQLQMEEAWDLHWRGRNGLKEDLRDEPLWPTIRDHLRVPGRLPEAGCGTGQWV